MCNCHEKTGKENLVNGPSAEEAPLESKCEAYVNRVNQHLGRIHDEKHNELLNCDGTQACKCGGTDDPTEVKKVDLIVLIDATRSNYLNPPLYADFVKKALDQVKDHCHTDLHALFLGVDGNWPGTPFDTSHRDYLTQLLNPVVIPFAGDRPYVGQMRSQGANAIEDLSLYNKWRNGACRIIYYISDKELDGDTPVADFANETQETQLAIQAANANQVIVYTNLIHAYDRPLEIRQNYTDLSQQTGGEAYLADKPSQEAYTDLILKMLCEACRKRPCREAKIPDFKPCISIRWGDSKCDCLETSDYEVMTIEVCNCYTDISFTNFNIGWIQVLDEDGGPVPMLPDETPSVKVTPIGPYCFGTIAPCSCVAREFVLFTEGARPGKYRLHIAGICFDVTQAQLVEDCFEFSLCKS